MLSTALSRRALGFSVHAARLARSHRVITPVVAFREAHKQTHEEVAENTSQVFNLEGRVAFVTGASGGVGSAAALALARCGADVFLTDATTDRLSACEKVKQQVEDLGRSAELGVCDVRDAKSVSAAIERFGKYFGKMDILVANAGILGEMEQPEELTEENWRNVFSVNVDGVMHCARAAYPLLKKSGQGKVIIMSSVAGISGYGPQAAYCASKGALIPLAKSLALAWAKDNINVNIVMPGAINTPFVGKILDNPEKLAYLKDRIPLGRLAEPHEVAGPILFFASSASNYCTGSVLVVDGGGTSRAMAQ